MNQTAMFIHLTYTDGLYAAQRILPGCLSNAPEDQVIQPYIYASDTLATVTDMAEEIVGEGYGTLIFTVDTTTLRLVRALTMALLEEDENLEIIWCGNPDSVSECPETVRIMPPEALAPVFRGDCLSVNTESIGDQAADFSKPAAGDSMLYSFAMNNGYFAYITGNYPEEVLGQYTKHIGFDFDEDHACMKDLGEYMNVNSAVIRSVSCFSGDAYNKIMSPTSKYEPFVSHYHQKYEEKGCTRIRFDNSDVVLNTAEMGYAEFSLLGRRDAIDRSLLYVLSILSREDLNAMLEDVRDYTEKGVISYPNFIVKDECRWSLKCNLKYLPRMNVRGNGGIQPCHTCSRTTGSVADPYFTTVRSLTKDIDKTYLSRSCKECPQCATCSKCAMCPDFLTAEEYCSVRRDHPLIWDFLDKKNVLRHLCAYTTALREVSTGAIKMSNPGYTVLYPSQVTQAQTADPERIVYLFYIDSTPLLFSHIKNAIFQIEPQLAFILEGYIKNVRKEEMASMFATAFSQSSEDSILIVTEGLEYLRNEGIVR